MDEVIPGYFSEVNDMWNGVCLSVVVTEVLCNEKSEYQNIMIFQSTHGRILVLDGIVQCTEFDEFSYQEMISFLPLCSHPNPEKVLIVGGGDGGVAREVAKCSSVKVIDMVEIDGKVIELSKKFLPVMSIGFDSPKLKLYIEDGREFVKHHKNEYDVIITDSSDPIGPAKCLFHKEYFNLLKDALKPNGIICCQAGSTWCSLNTAENSYKIAKEVFGNSIYARFSVPTYPTGEIGVVLASKNPETNFKHPIRVFSEDELEKMNLRFYNNEIHTASFALPQQFKKYFD